MNCVLWRWMAWIRDAMFAAAASGDCRLLADRVVFHPAVVGWWLERRVGGGCVMIGVNSFLWGYGISWLMTVFARWRRRLGPESARRGFDLAPTTGGERAAGQQTGDNLEH